MNLNWINKVGFVLSFFFVFLMLTYSELFTANHCMEQMVMTHEHDLCWFGHRSLRVFIKKAAAKTATRIKKKNKWNKKKMKKKKEFWTFCCVPVQLNLLAVVHCTMHCLNTELNSIQLNSTQLNSTQLNSTQLNWSVQA